MYNFLLYSINKNYLNFLSKMGDSAPDFKDLITTVTSWTNAFIIPVCVIIGGLSIYKLIGLGWKISHSADIPEERKIAIHGICWWAIGLVVCIVAPLLVNLLLPALLNGSGGKYIPPTK